MPVGSELLNIVCMRERVNPVLPEDAIFNALMYQSLENIEAKMKLLINRTFYLRASG